MTIFCFATNHPNTLKNHTAYHCILPTVVHSTYEHWCAPGAPYLPITYLIGYHRERANKPGWNEYAGILSVLAQNRKPALFHWSDLGARAPPGAVTYADDGVRAAAEGPEVVMTGSGQPQGYAEGGQQSDSSAAGEPGDM